MTNEAPELLRKYSRQLRKAGFSLEFLNGGHIRITAPDGSTAIQCLTPGNPGAQEKWIIQSLRRGSVATAKNPVGGIRERSH